MNEENTNLNLNINIDNYIWTKLLQQSNLKKERYNETYKKQLIIGYKIYRTKHYCFTNSREEKEYFRLPWVTQEEELFYYEILKCKAIKNRK